MYVYYTGLHSLVAQEYYSFSLKKEGKDRAAEENLEAMKVGPNKEKDLKAEEVQTQGRDQEVEKNQVVVKEEQEEDETIDQETNNFLSNET